MSPAARGHTIVVGYDGSDAARTALAYACGRAGDDGHVFVVHGYDLPPELLGAPYYDRLLAERQAHAQSVLVEVAQDSDGPQIETELIAGRPAEAIDAVARARHADEIVVGARGLSRARALLGSVSTELLHVADRPVVVIPAAAAAAHAAVDGA
jgi:nucleotide-binding universal stress UspA family protein